RVDPTLRETAHPVAGGPRTFRRETLEPTDGELDTPIAVLDVLRLPGAIGRVERSGIGKAGAHDRRRHGGMPVVRHLPHCRDDGGDEAPEELDLTQDWDACHGLPPSARAKRTVP